MTLRYSCRRPIATFWKGPRNYDLSEAKQMHIIETLKYCKTLNIDSTKKVIPGYIKILLIVIRILIQFKTTEYVEDIILYLLDTSMIHNWYNETQIFIIVMNNNYYCNKSMQLSHDNTIKRQYKLSTTKSKKLVYTIWQRLIHVHHQ